MIFACWLALEFYDVYAGTGLFSTSTRAVPTWDAETGAFPVYTIPAKDLLVTYSLMSDDADI